MDRLTCNPAVLLLRIKISTTACTGANGKKDIHANHMVFSMRGLKSNLLVRTSSSVSTTFSSTRPSSGSDLDTDESKAGLDLRCGGVHSRGGTALFVRHLSLVVEIETASDAQRGVVHRCRNRHRLRTSNIRVAQVIPEHSIRRCFAARRGVLRQLLNLVRREANVVVKDVIQR